MPTYPHILRAQAHGVPFELRATHPDLLTAAIPHLPYGTTLTPSAPPPATILHLQPESLRRAGKPLLTSSNPAEILEALHATLMVAVADLCPDRIFLHAGVVAWHGKAILLPGPSHAGKTTLTAELVRAGATYYSDEYALIDPTGLIHPFPRDLQMRRPGHSAQTPLAPGQLTSSPTGQHPIPAAAVLFLNYVPGATWSPQPLTPALAVLESLKHTAAIRRDPARVMATLTRAFTPAQLSRSPRGEAPETASQILAAF